MTFYGYLVEIKCMKESSARSYELAILPKNKNKYDKVRDAALKAFGEYQRWSKKFVATIPAEKTIKLDGHVLNKDEEAQNEENSKPSDLMEVEAVAIMLGEDKKKIWSLIDKKNISLYKSGDIFDSWLVSKSKILEHFAEEQKENPSISWRTKFSSSRTSQAIPKHLRPVSFKDVLPEFAQSTIVLEQIHAVMDLPLEDDLILLIIKTIVNREQ